MYPKLLLHGLIGLERAKDREKNGVSRYGMVHANCKREAIARATDCLEILLHLQQHIKLLLLQLGQYHYFVDTAATGCTIIAGYRAPLKAKLILRFLKII